VSRSLAELLLDYGEGYIGAGPLCWSPGELMLLLTDWLPREAILDPDQGAKPSRQPRTTRRSRASPLGPASRWPAEPRPSGRISPPARAGLVR
jgi:hypothetical protein